LAPEIEVPIPTTQTVSPAEAAPRVQCGAEADHGNDDLKLATLHPWQEAVSALVAHRTTL